MRESLAKWEDISKVIPDRTVKEIRLRWYEISRTKLENSCTPQKNNKNKQNSTDLTQQSFTTEKKEELDGMSTDNTQEKAMGEKSENSTAGVSEGDDGTWNGEETSLLRKLVEQYQDSKFLAHLHN